jgi:hypothetical protein
MLSEDPAFEGLAAEQRLPTFLQLSQVGSLADVEAALVSSAMLQNIHMANCGVCGHTANTLLHKNRSCAFQRCSYCVAAVCTNCCQHMQQLAADGDDDGEDSEQTQPTAAAAAAGAGAGARGVSSAAGRRAAAAAAAAAAAGDSRSCCWPQGLCPWCTGHPDTHHLYMSSSSPDERKQQQQQQQRQQQQQKQKQKQQQRTRQPRAAPITSARSSRRARQSGAGPDDEGDTDGGGSSMQDTGPQQQHRQSTPRARAAAAAAAAADSEDGLGPHTGGLSTAQVAAYAELVPMTDAQQHFLQDKLADLAVSKRQWWLMKPGAVAGVPEGVLVIHVSNLEVVVVLILCVQSVSWPLVF